MTDLCFVDTNVLVYGRDASEPDKQTRAHEWLDVLWRRRCGQTSVQVLNEYYVTVTRKLKPGLSEEEAWRDMDDLFAWQPIAVTTAIMHGARTASQRFALSWWDALIVATAQAGGCGYLLTEDLQDGQDFAGTLVVDPFRHRPEEVMADGA